MKIKHILLMFCAIGCLNLNILFAKNYNNLIMLLDPYEDEKIDGTSVALSFALFQALHQQVAPVITTSNILKNFCTWKINLQSTFNALKQEALKTKNINSVINKAQTLSSKIHTSAPGKNLSTFSLSILSFIDLNDNNWESYIHKKSNLVLLIPKKYRALCGKDNESCGFNLTNLNKIPQLMPNKLLPVLQKPITQSINIVDAIALMFTPLTKETREIAPSWNIYLLGHGSAAQIRKSPTNQEKIAQLKQNLTMREKHLALIKKRRIPAAPQKIQAIIDDINSIKQTIQSLSKSSAITKTTTETTLVPTATIVAGMDFNDFSQLLKFFNNSIKTSYLHYVTCFSSGYKQLWINEVLKKLNVKFIVSSEGTNEKFTVSYFPAININKTGTALEYSNLKFSDFFNDLEKFFSEPKSFAKQKHLKKDPFTTIIKSIISSPMVAENQPVIRFPGAGIFTTFSADKKIKILTHAMAKAHEHENKTLDLSQPPVEIIYLYTPSLQVPLKINSRTTIVSPTPQYLLPTDRITHIFQEIISPASLSDLISNFIYLNSSHFTITFIIKKLLCHNYVKSGLKIQTTQPITIQNMIIQLTGTLSNIGFIDTNIEIIFSHNNQHYAYSQKIANLADNKDKLFNLFKSLPAKPITTEQLKNYAQKMLPAAQAQLLIKKPVTIPAIVQEFEKSINTETMVQKLGALKKILLLKQLDFIKDALDPQTIQSQKAWLIENKKPLTNITKSLQRHKQKLNTLKNQIVQLSLLERASLEQRINELQNKINQELAKPLTYKPQSITSPQKAPAIIPVPIVKPIQQPQPPKQPIIRRRLVKTE